MPRDGSGAAAPAIAVVLLHGQPGAADDWDSVVAALPTDMRALALDRPGYGTNPEPPGGFADNAHWLLEAMDRAEITDAVLVGHSYGGAVALATAALAPDRIRGLVLVASVGPDCLDGWDALLSAPISGPVCAVAAWWLTPWFARRRIARIERRRRRPLAAHEHANWQVWGRARHRHGAMWRTFLTEQRALVHGIDALNATLPHINTPSLVIADPADKMIPIATAYAIADRLPHAELVLAERRTGHHLPRRAARMLADEIERFVDSIEQPTAHTQPRR